MRLLLLIAALGIFFNLSSTSLPDQEVPNTLGMQTKDNSSSTADIEAIKDVGAKFIRKGIYWNRVERIKGVYDFSSYDRIFQDAEDRGLYVLGVLYGSNDLYENDGLGGIQTEAGRQGFAAFGAALAEHFKGKNIIWEIWNEPNVRTFWNQQGMHNSDEFAEEYTALVSATAPAMVAADPECFVVAGSVSNFWEPSYYWTNACFERGIGESGIRGWSVHPYGLKTPEEYVIGYNRTRNIFVQNNIPYDFPILNSERGFSLEKLDEGWSGGDVENAEEYQAWHFVRQYMIDLLNDIHLSIWYEWLGSDFGILYGGERRRAYYACRTMVDELAGYTLKERLYTESQHDYLLIFENSTGQQKMVAWTAPLAGEAPDQYIPHTIEIPRRITNKVSVHDIYGGKAQFEIQNEKIRIELTGSPKYISFIPPSHNANLSAITWPDAPELILSNPEWNHDTIPDFSPESYNYTVILPAHIKTVPSLYATPGDINASISIVNAKTLEGPSDDRKTYIQVKAEDDTTIQTYTVEFRKEYPYPHIWSYNYLVRNDSLLIRGIPEGTSVEIFLGNLLADSLNLDYSVIGINDGLEKAGSDILTNLDTLAVYTQDSSDVSAYVLYVSDADLDNNAVLSSEKYSIEFNGSNGKILNIDPGSTVKEVLDSINIPINALLTIINGDDEPVPLQILNSAGSYISASVQPDLFFKVTAEDMQTIIIYHLEVDTTGNDIFIFSDLFEVDQQSGIIASIPDGISVSSFLSYLWASPGGDIHVHDESGVERTMEILNSEYYATITGNSGLRKKTYKLQMLSESEGIYAYVLSDLFSIDQDGKFIYGITDTLQVSGLLNNLIPALDADITILDINGSTKSSGNIIPGEDKLRVTSGNQELTVIYQLLTEPLYTVTFAIGDGVSSLEGAELIINNDTLVSNQNGIISLLLPNGEYNYSVSKEAMTASGKVIVLDNDLDVSVLVESVAYPLVITVSTDQEPVSGAIIMIDGRYYFTDASGQVTVDLTDGEYFYTVTVSGFDDKTGYVAIENSSQILDINFQSVSVDKELTGNIIIYPNPTDGEFIIRRAEITLPMEVKIYNMIGIKVYHRKFYPSTQEIIDLSREGSGIYLMQLNINSTNLNYKIVIK